MFTFYSPNLRIFNIQWNMIKIILEMGFAIPIRKKDKSKKLLILESWIFVIIVNNLLKDWRNSVEEVFFKNKISGNFFGKKCIEALFTSITRLPLVNESIVFDENFQYWVFKSPEYIKAVFENLSERVCMCGKHSALYISKINKDRKPVFIHSTR